MRGAAGSLRQFGGDEGTSVSIDVRGTLLTLSPSFAVSGAASARVETSACVGASCGCRCGCDSAASLAGSVMAVSN